MSLRTTLICDRCGKTDEEIEFDDDHLVRDKDFCYECHEKFMRLFHQFLNGQIQPNEYPKRGE